MCLQPRPGSATSVQSYYRPRNHAINRDAKVWVFEYTSKQPSSKTRVRVFDVSMNLCLPVRSDGTFYINTLGEYKWGNYGPS
jgi:hypothetical protein